MKRENAYLTHYRRYRVNVLRREQPIVTLVRAVVLDCFKDDDEISRMPRYQIIKRYTWATALREFTELSLHEIGDIVGLDHACVVYGRKKLRKTYFNHEYFGPRIQRCISEIENAIEKEVLAAFQKAYEYELT